MKDRDDSLLIHNTVSMTDSSESLRECQMNVIRNRIAVIATVALLFSGVPLLLTVSTGIIPLRRRINPPVIEIPLGDLSDVTPPIHISNRKTQRPPPSAIAWLMSFPNSGTSYTMRLITRTTKTLVATNYQKTESSEERQLYPVYSGHSEGPFWPDPNQSQYRTPPSYVLTKTHCGSRCNDCGPVYYLRDFKDFEKLCSTGSKLERSPDGREESITVSYNNTQVKRAIHLIRNPFDNVVARFHLERHRMVKSNETDKLAQFPDSREGFRNFCGDMNHRWHDEVKRFWLKDEIGMMRDLPCRDDFFRYVVWHNLAFAVTHEKLRIPSLVVHYEDYEERFKETVSELFDFLDLEPETEPYPFHKGHTYHDYFTTDERIAAARAMKIISTNTTWDNIVHYFL